MPEAHLRRIQPDAEEPSNQSGASVCHRRFGVAEVTWPRRGPSRSCIQSVALTESRRVRVQNSEGAAAPRPCEEAGFAGQEPWFTQRLVEICLLDRERIAARPPARSHPHSEG